MDITRKKFGKKKNMTKNIINVSIYGYKSKTLIDVVENLLNNQSNKNVINVYVVDQHPLNRKDKFASIINYQHVFWDNIKNPNQYKNYILYNTFSNYFLQIGDGVFLNKNWDEDLLNIYKNYNGSILSGNNKVSLEIKKYKIITNKTFNNNIYESGYSDKNFIFAQTNVLKFIGFSKTVKYNGEDEEFSCKAFNNNIKIYCLPNYFYIDKTLDLNNHPYVPFSLNHEYKKVKDILLNSQNFLKFHGLKINNLKEFPYPSDDVIYDLDKSLYNKVGGEKFYTTIKEIG